MAKHQKIASVFCYGHSTMLGNTETPIDTKAKKLFLINKLYNLSIYGPQIFLKAAFVRFLVYKQSDKTPWSNGINRCCCCIKKVLKVTESHVSYL